MSVETEIMASIEKFENLADANRVVGTEVVRRFGMDVGIAEQRDDYSRKCQFVIEALNDAYKKCKELDEAKQV